MIDVTDKNAEGKAQVPVVAVCASVRVRNAELKIVTGIAGTTVLVDDATVVDIILRKGVSARQGDATLLESSIVRRAALLAGGDRVEDLGGGTFQVESME